MAKRTPTYYMATAFEGGTNYGGQSLVTADRSKALEMGQSVADKTGHQTQLYYYGSGKPRKLKTFKPQTKTNPKIGPKLTKVRIKVGKGKGARVVSGVAKKVAGRVRVWVTEGVAKGLPKRYQRNPQAKLLVKGANLSSDQLQKVLAKFVNRHIAVGPGKRYATERDWINDHAFRFTKSGQLSGKWAEPYYMAD